MASFIRSMSSADSALFHKALAIMLKPFIMNSYELSRAKSALFVAMPFTHGIPEGDNIAQEASNEQIYRTADPLQDGSNPIFGYSRNGSYFDRQYQYLINVVDESDDQSESATVAVGKALAATKLAYQEDVARYQALAATVPGLNFNEWMTQYGFEYNYAYAELKAAQARLAKEQSRPLSDVKARLQSMLTARSPTTHVIGSNMPAVLSDYNSIEKHLANMEAGPDKSVYRPLHYMSGYEDTVRAWVSGYRPQDINIETSIELSDAENTSWDTIGFPALDSVTQTRPTLRNARLELKGYGVQSFAIFRGLWNIDNIREILPTLSAKTPPSVHVPFFKTTRLLFGYGLQLSLTVPASSTQSAFARVAASQLEVQQRLEHLTRSTNLPSGFPAMPPMPSFEGVGSFTGVESLTSALPSPEKRRRRTSSPQEPPPEADQQRTTIWKLSSDDNGTPALLAVLANLI